MLALGNDSGLLLRSLHQSLREIGHDRSLATSIDPVDGQLVSESDAKKDNTFMSTNQPKGK